MSAQSCRLMSTASRVSLSSTASPPTEIINAVERPDKVKMGPINLSIGFNVTLQLVCKTSALEHTLCKSTCCMVHETGDRLLGLRTRAFRPTTRKRCCPPSRSDSKCESVPDSPSPYTWCLTSCVCPPRRAQIYSTLRLCPRDRTHMHEH